MICKKILIATDGSELADRAVAHGLKLAKELKVPVVVGDRDPYVVGLGDRARSEGSPRPIRLKATKARQRRGPKES